MLKFNCCTLSKIITKKYLKFDFNYGACTVANNQITLCFDSTNVKQCYQSNGDLDHFNPLEQSNDHHMRTRIAASGDAIFAVGDRNEFLM